MSFNFLNLFGDDEDSLAAAMSHQYAHIVVGDDADVQDSREVNYFLTKEIVSTGVSLFATAAGGYGAGAAIDEAKRIADAKIEDQVNPMAIKWLTNAGYTPCGYLKMKKVMERNSEVSSALTYLFTHPGIDERVKLSNDYLKANNLDCGDLESFAKSGLIKKSGQVLK
jgi:predicted Zn-dependent protease